MVGGLMLTLQEGKITMPQSLPEPCRGQRASRLVTGGRPGPGVKDVAGEQRP